MKTQPGKIRSRRSGLLLSGVVLLAMAALLVSFQKQSATFSENLPVVLDDRLELSLFAEDPSIVTPIGIAVDSLDRIYVLESHTHQPPADYDGPKSDQIKIFLDKNGDGQPDELSVFADGFREGVNLAFSPEGHLYVVTSRAVWALYDRDGDGKSDDRKKVLELTKPASVYAHAALLGITFSADGWMYISRGNTSGAAWQLEGTDGSTLRGYGDGGNVARARPDGSRLEEISTGFWNPMDLKFDDRGHLLAADNDPDSRGPNRLVHVVPGGNYGYQSLYGGSGIHPYLAWNGELPGTLPYAVGLGEAPSGLLNASLAALPSDYRGQMLASIWEESSLVRISLRPRGASVSGTSEVIVQGGQNFRPVAFATDSRGTIYFTDWVLRNYPNHGKGKIWKLSARKDQPTLTPRPLYAPYLPDPEGTPFRTIYAAQSLNESQALLKALSSTDPYERHAAGMALSRPVYRQKVIQAANSTDPLIRVGALLTLQRSGYQPAPELIQKFLTDPDEQVRQGALIWIGQAGMAEMVSSLENALTSGPVSPALFDSYLETVRHLQPEFISAYRSQKETYAKSIPRSLPPRFVENLVRDTSRPEAIRAMAIKMIEHPERELALLLPLLSNDKSHHLQQEAVRTLSMVPDSAVAERLLALAARREALPHHRAEALLGLSKQPHDVSGRVLSLLNDPAADVQLEAARYLRGYTTAPAVRKALLAKYQARSTAPALKEQIALATGEKSAASLRPASYADWEKALGQPGDAVRGRRVFYASQAVCASCHAVQGRGGDLGPDLSNVGQSKSHAQLVRSILQPSAEITPEWQGWYIQLTNGDYYQGRQIDVGEKSIELYTQGTGFMNFSKKEIKDYGMIKNSLMPEGLENQLTVSDLRDLIAFLKSDKK
jgi:putative membrane-bound dehydrogenase-like protein